MSVRFNAARGRWGGGEFGVLELEASEVRSELDRLCGPRMSVGLLISAKSVEVTL